MPLFDKLFAGAMGSLFTFIAGFVGVKVATRMLAVAAIATAYIGTISVFVTFVSPSFSAITTTGYGQVLGLAFPPVAGTVIVGLFAYKMSVVAARYTASLMKMAIG